MENISLSPKQHYENKVACYIIMSNINGMNTNDFIYGYQLYLDGKRMHRDETASKLAEYLIGFPVDMSEMDEAFDVIEIKEYMESLEEQHSNQR